MIQNIRTTPSHAAVAGVAVLAAALRLAAAFAIPHGWRPGDPNCAPDEAAHLEIARRLSQGEAPRWPGETWSVYAVFPAAPYAVHAVCGAALPGLARAEAAAPRPPLAEARGYLSLRLGGVLLGTLAVVLLGLAACAWAGDVAAFWVAGLVAAGYPQHVFLSGYVNADSFSFTAGAGLALAVARWRRRGATDGGTAAIGLWCGALLTGKASMFYLLPPTAAWVGWAAWRGTVSRVAVRRALLLGTLVAAPFLAWNAARYGGDALGTAQYARFIREVWHGKTMSEVPRGGALLWELLPTSAFATFGNMGVRLTRNYYLVAAMLAGAGVAHAAWLAARRREVRGDVAWAASSTLANLALVVWNCWKVDFSPQGRYVLLPAAALAILAATAPLHLRGRARWLSFAVAAFYVVSGAYGVSVLWRRPGC